MTNCSVLFISTAIVIAIFGQTRAAVIPPEWADVRINPCAKVRNYYYYFFNFQVNYVRTVISFQVTYRLR
jgi:hypothetical protein